MIEKKFIPALVQVEGFSTFLNGFVRNSKMTLLYFFNYLPIANKICHETFLLNKIKIF